MFFINLIIRLILSFEMKKEDSLKPYGEIFLLLFFNLLNLPITDAKKSVWVPDGEGGFDEAMIDTVDGDKVNVKVGWEPKTFKSAQVMQVNPPKMASDFFCLIKEVFALPFKDFLLPSDEFLSFPFKPAGEVRGCVEHDLPQRGRRLVELEVALRVQADLHLLWTLLCKCN